MITKRLKLLFALIAAAAFAAGCAQNEDWRLKPISGILPDLAFNLTEGRGKAVTAADFRGKTVLLFFGYTNCPDVCPMTLARLQQALAQVDDAKNRVRVLFVTVDPARDTPERMREYTRAFGPEFIGLRGSEDALRDLARRYRIGYSLGEPDANGNYVVTHSSSVMVFDGAGRARLLILPQDGVGDITADLARLTAAGARQSS